MSLFRFLTLSDSIQSRSAKNQRCALGVVISWGHFFEQLFPNRATRCWCTRVSYCSQEWLPSSERGHSPTFHHRCSKNTSTLHETILNATKAILKVMILLSANTEEQILYLLPIVITDPSCTIWSWKSSGSNYTLLGLKVREMGGCVQLAHQGRSVHISSIHVHPL